jgi:hypothetical protein
MTLGLRFNVEARLQHVQFSRECAQPSKHLGRALPAQRPWAFDDE